MKVEVIILAFPIVLAGVVFLIQPLLTRPGIFFSATVDPEFPRSSEGRRVLRSYQLQVGFWTIPAVALVVIFAPQHPRAGMLAPVFGLVAAVAFTYWRKFREVHTRFGVSRPEVRRASLSSAAPRESFGPGLLLPPFLAIAAAAIYLQLHWSELPQVFPVHWGANGEPNRWADRTWLGVYGPLLMGTAMNLFMLGLAWLISSVSRKTAMRFVTVRFVQTLIYPLTFTFVTVSLLPLLHVPARAFSVVAITMVVMFAVIAVLLYWSYRRVSTPTIESDEVPEPQSDSYWKAGMFYYNPSDPAIFVAKRVGIGYTINFANKVSWLVLAGVLMLAVLPALLLRSK